MSDFDIIFQKAQKELTRDGFVSWVCQAYGSMSSSIKGRQKQINIKVLNEAINTLKKENEPATKIETIDEYIKRKTIQDDKELEEHYQRECREDENIIKHILKGVDLS